MYLTTVQPLVEQESLLSFRNALPPVPCKYDATLHVHGRSWDDACHRCVKEKECVCNSLDISEAPKWIISSSSSSASPASSSTESYIRPSLLLIRLQPVTHSYLLKTNFTIWAIAAWPFYFLLLANLIVLLTTGCGEEEKQQQQQQQQQNQRQHQHQQANGQPHHHQHHHNTSNGANDITTTPVTATRNGSNEKSPTSPRAHPTGSSDNDNVDKLKRKRQPRNSACQSCAALKMKCIATSTPGICERCCRMNRECIPAVPKPRKRRATDSFEPKGIPLSDLIDQSHKSPRVDSFRPSPRGYMVESANSGSRTTSSPEHSDINGRSFSREFAYGLGLDNRLADYLLHGIDQTFVQRCCHNFSYTMTLFPFVSIPYADAKTLIVRRPVTAAAICTVASVAHQDTQVRLMDAFRHALSNKCIMEGEKSVDLLVGLLIFLAWHHQYYHRQQIYQLCCLLASMATDLGLQKTPSLSEQSRSFHDRELHKAFIGVYYFTTTLSLQGFSRPCPIQWCPSLDHFASSLYSTSGEMNLQPYIDLAHLLQDHAELLAAAPTVQPASYIELATKSALARLKTLKRIHPSATSIPAYAAASVHINARALTSSSTSPSSLELPGAALLQTAMASKGFFDDLLVRPPLALHHVSLLDWTNLLENLILVTKLSSPDFLSSLSKFASGGLGWESSALGAVLKPDTILDAVCAHMAAAPADGKQGPRNEWLLGWLRGICEVMKRRIAYDRSAAVDDSAFETISKMDRVRSGSAAGSDGGRFRAVNAEPLSAISPRTQRPGYGSWSGGRSVPDITFSLFGGHGMLDEGFWASFNDFG